MWPDWALVDRLLLEIQRGLAIAFALSVGVLLAVAGAYAWAVRHS